ncbi:MAG: GntR family transcriptional regulator [Slackia sp.]|nr:GntR family transcriptional regulator [Slackia sp.]
MTTGFPFEVDSTSNVPPWVQLSQRIAYLISTGYFKPGDKLPTVRALAAEVSLNFNTVNKAYLSLADDGYVESTRGRGVFVRNVNEELGKEHTQQIDRMLDDFISGCRDMGLSLDDIQQRVNRRVKQMKKDEKDA